MAQWNANTVPKCEKGQWSDEVLVTVEKGRYCTDWWIPEGWYEVCDNCPNATYFPIDGKTIAWMKLPKLYESKLKDLGEM